MYLRLSLLLISTLAFSRTSSLATDGGEERASILQSSDVLIAAHRGGYETDKADRAPENSIANIRVCQSKGYDLYETDIQRTKDGHFVILHDATIDRETTGTGKASDLDLSELKSFSKRYRDGSISEERVATLEEFLQEGKGRTIFKADLKPGVSVQFKEILKQVVKHDAMDGILFRVPYREADQFARLEIDEALLGSLLMFKVSSKEQVDEIKTRFDPVTIQINVSKSNPASDETLDLIRYAASQGMLVEAHAEGTPDDWAKMVEAGVRMFHTGKPTRVQEFLESRRKKGQRPAPLQE